MNYYSKGVNLMKMVIEFLKTMGTGLLFICAVGLIISVLLIVLGAALTHPEFAAGVIVLIVAYIMGSVIRNDDRGRFDDM